MSAGSFACPQLGADVVIAFAAIVVTAVVVVVVAEKAISRSIVAVMVVL